MRDKLNRSKCCVTILISIEILAGLILLSITTYFYYILIAYLPKTERQVLLSQMSNIVLLSLEVLIGFSIEFLLWQYICKSDSTVEHSRMLLLWNIFCILAIAFGSVTMWFQYKNIESLQRLYAASLFEGIDLYFTDPEWKLLWDRIQFNNECCGVFGITDWQEAQWIPEEQEDCLEKSNLIHPMVMIPFACCKRSSISCFQSFAPHSTIIDEDVDKDFNNINLSGCFQKFKSLTVQFTRVASCILVVILVAYISILVLMLCIISRSKRITFNPLLDCSEETDELPLVVVKYPRNVRCITLTDEDSFGNEQEEIEMESKQRCSNCHAIGTSIRQDVFETCNAKRNIFVH